jgi:DNA invertase Pin-like site-specific DNA recombinase
MTVSTRKELRAVAERMDWQVVAEYIDHGISGAKGRDQHPAYDRLYSAIVRREIDLVRDLEKIKLRDLRRIVLRLQGAPRGAYSLYVTLGATPKTEP